MSEGMVDSFWYFILCPANLFGCSPSKRQWNLVNKTQGGDIKPTFWDLWHCQNKYMWQMLKTQEEACARSHSCCISPTDLLPWAHIYACIVTLQNFMSPVWSSISLGWVPLLLSTYARHYLQWGVYFKFLSSFVSSGLELDPFVFSWILLLIKGEKEWRHSHPVEAHRSKFEMENALFMRTGGSCKNRTQCEYVEHGSQSSWTTLDARPETSINLVQIAETNLQTSRNKH
jgi:hypothetical protein